MTFARSVGGFSEVWRQSLASAYLAGTKWCGDERIRAKTIAPAAGIPSLGAGAVGCACFGLKLLVVDVRGLGQLVLLGRSTKYAYELEELLFQ
jgi:hypothetical protein